MTKALTNSSRNKAVTETKPPGVPTCRWCGEANYGRRSDTKYCTARPCRQAAYNERRRRRVPSLNECLQRITLKREHYGDGWLKRVERYGPTGRRPKPKAWQTGDSIPWYIGLTAEGRVLALKLIAETGWMREHYADAEWAEILKCLRGEPHLDWHIIEGKRKTFDWKTGTTNRRLLNHD